VALAAEDKGGSAPNLEMQTISDEAKRVSTSGTKFVGLILHAFREPVGIFNPA